jgi:hypothetical protein
MRKKNAIVDWTLEKDRCPILQADFGKKISDAVASACVLGYWDDQGYDKLVDLMVELVHREM